MIRIETQNKYIGDQRDGETHFLELVYCTKYQFCKESARRVIPTDKYELFCVISGEVYIPNVKKRIDKNSIILIKKFSRIKLEIKENTEIVHIAFTASDILPSLSSSGNLLFLENFGNFPLINKLYRFASNKNYGAGIKEALLLELLHDINDYSIAAHSKITLYKRACAWIEKNSVKAITSQDVAVALNCSRAHLNRIIKMLSGECLSDVVARCRLERVKNLCDGGNISVSEIANRLDFCSVELLCKFFKYHEGISITEYIKKIKL